VPAGTFCRVLIESQKEIARRSAALGVEKKKGKKDVFRGVPLVGLFLFVGT
jgi:hypothetical protein